MLLSHGPTADKVPPSPPRPPAEAHDSPPPGHTEGVTAVFLIIFKEWPYSFAVGAIKLTPLRLKITLNGRNNGVQECEGDGHCSLPDNHRF